MTHNQPTSKKKPTFLALIIRSDAQLGRRANSRKISLVIFFLWWLFDLINSLDVTLQKYCRTYPETPSHEGREF